MTRLTLEARLPCPVCLGVKMKKARLRDASRNLLLDWCPRCGGIWFELGEVQHLRNHPSQSLWSRIPERAEPFRMPCHECQAIIDRNAEACTVCGWKNTIDCPACDRPLKLEVHEGLRLDVCSKCHGVWFDHVELSAIWNQSLKARPRRFAVRDRTTGDARAGWGVLEVISYSPDLLFYGARATGMAIESGANAIGHAPEVAGAILEGAGDAAGGLFDAVVEIIGGMFE